jgi:hypothetical protein
MSTQRIRFNRSVFTAPLNGHAPTEVIAELAAEDIELVLDVRGGATDDDAGSQLGELCALADMYYLRRPRFDSGGGGEGVAWAAGLALRHRTCVLGDPDAGRLQASEAIAKAGGMRVIDLESSPAPISRTGRPPQPPG